MQIKNWSDVPGFINDTHANHIRQVSSQLPNNAKVIEVGCMWGRSTWCWLDNLSSDAELTTIDMFFFDDCNNLPVPMQQTWQGSLEIFEISKKIGCKNTWHNVVSQHANKDISRFFWCDSLDFDPMHQNYDCVYLDGDHRYDHLQNELSKFEPICDVICGDDYRHEHPDVIKAVDEMVKKTGRILSANIKDKSGFWLAKKT